jgi:8-oxo-dGTP pyrophosphatase MutT (NUDIX family)
LTGSSLLKIYRVPWTGLLGDPRGFAEKGEAPAECARREFQEETGLTIRPEKMVNLGSVFPDSGILATHIELFTARLEQPFPDRIPLIGRGHRLPDRGSR